MQSQLPAQSCTGISTSMYRSHILQRRRSQRQCELGDVDVTIDITLTLVNVTGKVIVLLHLNGSTARLTNCTSEHILMFLVICAVLQTKLEHGFAHLRIAQFGGREAISPNCPILKEKGSV